MNLQAEAILDHRLRAHHLDRRLPLACLEQAAGACGVQNSPPGAWETALFNRVEGCTLEALQEALCRKKSLLQAWSYRGVPAVFPTAESGVFLSPLAARPGEEPWIYTRGITAGLDFVGMRFDEALPLVKSAAAYLGTHTVQSKEELDRVLARLVAQALPPGTQALWNAPSMYGRPDRQTVGGAIVSFMLRPCAFSHLVVFGERRGASPTFTSFENWTGRQPEPAQDGGRRLAEKFLHCYGPATRNSFMDWLGCCPRQAARLWGEAAEGLAPVQVEGKTRYMLARDLPGLRAAPPEGRLLLLGPHDPYLDLKDRALILPEQRLQRLVWKTVANPGVVLQGGRAVGIWRAHAAQKLEVAITLWQPPAPAQRRALEALAEEYAAFRQLPLKSCAIAAL